MGSCWVGGAPPCPRAVFFLKRARNWILVGCTKNLFCKAQNTQVDPPHATRDPPTPNLHQTTSNGEPDPLRCIAVCFFAVCGVSQSWVLKEGKIFGLSHRHTPRSRETHPMPYNIIKTRLCMFVCEGAAYSDSGIFWVFK